MPRRYSLYASQSSENVFDVSEPLPDSGWSREIVSVQNALVMPPPFMTGMPECGVSVAGEDCLHASTWRDGVRMTRPFAEPDGPVQRLPGRHLWGGFYLGHFGHFITETMSRCWAFDRDDVESILFIPKHDRLKPFGNYQMDLWKLLKPAASAEIVRNPVVVDELVVPGQGFGLGAISAGTPEFRAAIRRAADRIAPDGPERIYISRTRFGGRGGIIDEVSLERNFERNGYTVIHPERMPLVKQLEHYKAARYIVGLDSSAFHIVGMVADDSKKIAFILRRENQSYRSIARQIEGMIGRSPDILRALVANWMVETQKQPNHLSWGELDHTLLAQLLEEHGYIGSRNNWSTPDARAVEDGVARAAEISRAPLVRRANPQPQPGSQARNQ